MNLQTPPKVEKLQRALHAKAKREPGYRFYLLYDKLYREDVLTFAYRVCKANGGAPGVDGQTFADIESYGGERWLGELTQELKEKTYRPQAVRRVWIPKANGKKRPLGIPTIKDRVVQTAALLVLGPIFEADLQSEQYAYRPDRSASDAVQTVFKHLKRGHTQVVDADLSGYFDSIPHAELIKSTARRISDRHMLHLIKQWLMMPVEETDDRGRKHRTNPNRKQKRGTPQGAPTSPLFANIYMRRLIVGWKVLGHEKRLDAHIVNYADDFVICCRRASGEADRVMRKMMQQLKLTINTDKTRLCDVRHDTFDFLGYTFGRMYSPRTGGAYLGLRPSKKAVQRLCRTVSEATASRWVHKGVPDTVAKLNRTLVGWANYFCQGTLSKAYRTVDSHVRTRLRQWLCRKQKGSNWKASRYPASYLYDELGLVSLPDRRYSLSRAKA